MVITKFVRRFLRRHALAAGYVIILSISAAASASSDDSEVRAHEQWSDDIANTPTPTEGCFMAEYPSLSWMPVGCMPPPNRPHPPKQGPIADTVGNGDDYVAVSSVTIRSSVGSFPRVTNVTSESDPTEGGENIFSLQLNSNYMFTGPCLDSPSPACKSWQQFIYSSGGQEIYMQYWLVDYGKYCPPAQGWNQFGDHCFQNSNAVFAPRPALSDLSAIRLTGRAVYKGRDTVVFSNGSLSYAVAAKDKMLNLATAWKQSEYNIFGDGSPSKAIFNKGAKITVKVGITNGLSDAPACNGGSGTTQETNNLRAHIHCLTFGGASPHIQFIESN
jgi:hypothetical protein